MKIATKAKLASTTALVAIALIGAMIWWAIAEVQQAAQQRRLAIEIVKALDEQRLVTIEFILHRLERAQQQQRGVTQRIDRLLVGESFSAPEPAAALAMLRERVAQTRRIFDDFVAPPATGTAAPAELQRFEAQLSSRLLILQQESLADAFRLIDFSTGRINAAQERVVYFVLGGLLLIALTMGGVAWFVHRGVLVPISRLEQATREVASGNWNFKLDSGSSDEIGDTSRHFDAMTQALRESFAQIERSNQELAALNKEMEAFSYSVSHDLRGPLRAMDGFSLALLEDYADKLDSEGKDYLQRIRKASQRMGRLIDELLGLSRVTRAELSVRAVDLSAMAREIADSLEQQGPQRSVQWQIEEGITVQADKALMQIAMQNLLENAWKFTGKTEHPVIRVGTTLHNGQKNCFVADNGVGFDMAYADRLFGAFQRLHHESEFSGTGIGLAIVQRIVRRHEGQIWVEAQPGRGATFFFKLGNHVSKERNAPLDAMASGR